MNSLSELNAYAAELITFTDLRTPGPVFDRPAAQNQIVNVNQNDDHTVANGIEIVDIIRPTDAYTTLTIDATNHAGAVITWPTIPSGCLVTNPSTGIYSISGINSVATWNIIKNPTFYPDANFVGVFSYTVTIDWYPSNSITWTVNVTINDIDNLSTASDFYFDASQTGLITGNPTVIDNYSTTWTVRVTPSNIAYITTLSSAGTGGTSSFNNTTKVLTIAGTKTQVNARLNAITYVTSASATTDFTFSYYAINDTTNEGDIKVQEWDSTRYISATRANDTYTLNTSTSITGGPLITDTGASGLGQYTMIIGGPTASTSTMSTTGRQQWQSQTTFNNPIPGTTNLDRFTAYLALSGDKKVIVTGSDWDSQNDSILGEGVVYVYYSLDTSWSTSTPYAVINGAQFTSGSVRAGIGKQVAVNSDGTTIAFGSRNEVNLAGPGDPSTGGLGKIRVYTRNGTTLTLQATINPTETDFYSLSTGAIKLSDDGNTLAFRLGSTGPRSDFILIYTRSGSTWTKQAKLSPSDYTGSDNDFGLAFDLSADGNTLAVGATLHSHSGITNSGAVYVFTRSGTTWTQQQELQASNVVTNKRFGSRLKLSTDSNSLAVYAEGYTGVSSDSYVFTRSGTTWTQQSMGIDISSIKRDLTSTLSISQRGTASYTLTNFVLSNDGNLLIGSSPTAYSNQGAFVTFNIQTIGTSFNNVEKMLTLTGNKAQINADIDTIQFTPAAGYVSDITLTYEVFTPGGYLDRRTQLITYTP